MKIKGEKEKWIKKRLANTSIVFRNKEIKFKAFDKKTEKVMDVKIIDFLNKKVGLGNNEYDNIKWRKFKDVIFLQWKSKKDINK